MGWLDDKIPGKVGDEEERVPFEGGSCIDWEDDRRKKGIEDGVNRFEWLRRMDEVGLSAPAGGAERADAVLALESVPGRLE